MSSVTHFFGSIFQPIFKLFGWLLAFFYGIEPNYAIAIVLLTILIMGVLTPFTIKSTRSMASMQNLQPEIKKLQVKYKGAENRQLLNEELMKLYREEGVSPLGGCLPMLIQFPFLFILYSVIKGLANTVTSASGVVTPLPRYIPHASAMYDNLVASGGKINVWGMNLNLRPFPISAHGTFLAAIPFFIFVILAVGLQYVQMAQLNSRSRKTGQAIPQQAQMMQRVMPVLFAYIYLVIPAAVVLYMIVSTIIRIITQDLMFRAGVSNPNKATTAIAGPREIPGEVVEAPPALPAAPTTPAPALTAKSTPPRPPRAPRNRTNPQPRANPNSANAQRSRSKRKRKAR